MGEVIGIPEGIYEVGVSLQGGSGRASLESPTIVTVSGETAEAVIRFSSPNYDYVLYEGEKLLPVNQEGNSEFLLTLPLAALSEEVPIIADTTAMSVPHEIEYTIVFDTDSLTAVEEGRAAGGELIIVCVLLILVAFSMERHVARIKYRRRLRD